MKRLLPVFVLLLLASCSFRENDPLSFALNISGENRTELQKVLDYYSAPADSLKRRAAEYLIGNMAGKYTVTSPALEAYEELLPEIALVPADEGLSSPRIENMFREFRQSHPQTQDTRLRQTKRLATHHRRLFDPKHRRFVRYVGKRTLARSLYVRTVLRVYPALP